MALTPAERARLDALRQARDGGERFAAFVRRLSPELGPVVPRHLQRMYELAEETRRRAVWATISMPPRLGKSTTARSIVGWRLLRDPSCLNFYVTYGDKLAKDFSYKTRKLAIAAGVPLARDRADVHDWATIYDGGLKSTSIGGDITGRGSRGGIIIPDDLIKNREEAESLTIRDKAWSSLLDDVLSRRDDDRVSVMLPGTRWHLDDPLGRIFKNDLGEQWDHIKLAAVVHAITGEPVDGGERGEDFDPEIHIPIWPEGGKNLAWARKERCKGASRWWSLYLQEPRSGDDKLFEHEPARFNLDAFTLDDGWRLTLAMDPAGTAKTTSDFWSVGVVAVRGYGEACEGRILARIHIQAKIGAVLRKVRALREVYPLPLRVEGVGGFALIPDMIREVDPDLPVELIPSDMVNLAGGKRAKAMSYSEAWNAGRFAVPLGLEWDGYISEHMEFTGNGDAHDDDVDMSAYGWRLGWRGEPDEIYGATVYGG